MGVLDRLEALARGFFTAETEIRVIREQQRQHRDEQVQLVAALQELRERVVRLETARDADRSHLETEISRFKLEVERAEVRLQRPPLAGPE